MITCYLKPLSPRRFVMAAVGNSHTWDPGRGHLRTKYASTAIPGGHCVTEATVTEVWLLAAVPSGPPCPCWASGNKAVQSYGVSAAGRECQCPSKWPGNRTLCQETKSPRGDAGSCHGPARLGAWEDLQNEGVNPPGRRFLLFDFR